MYRNFAASNRVVVTAGTTGTISAPIDVRDYQHILLTLVAGTGVSAATIKVRGTADHSDVPTLSLSNASNATTSWDYIRLTPYNSGADIAGGTGATFAAAGTTIYELNTNLLANIAVEIVTATGGTITAKIWAADNK